MAFGLGRVAHGFQIAFVQVFQAGQQYTEVTTAAIGFEVIGDFHNGRHSFAYLAEEFQTDRACMRRHLVQYPACCHDNAVGTFFLYAWHATEELVGHILT